MRRTVYGCGNPDCTCEWFRVDGKLVKLYGPPPEGWWGKRNFDTASTNHYWPANTPRVTLCGIHGTPGQVTGSGMCRECQKRGAPTTKLCEGCGTLIKATWWDRYCPHCAEMADTAEAESWAAWT